MKEKVPTEIEKCRIINGQFKSDSSYGFNGAFIIECPHKLLCIVSDQLGWDHISVSVYKKKRCPDWQEMCFIKKKFFKDSETVIQYHPPEKDNINVHYYTLHLWRPQNEIIPMPPKCFV